MRSIKNLKDPTMDLFIWRLLLLPLLVGGGGGVVAATPTKVSCITHDTQITCDCHNNNEQQAMVLPQLQGAVYQVEVRNCRQLSVQAYALAATEGLRKVSFRHVDGLRLEKYALSVARYASNKALILEFEQVNFELIDSHAINGNIDEISFVGGRIELIKPFGFTTTKDSAILLKLYDVTVHRIESQAFKKFAVEQMLIANCHFTSSVPTRAFYELEVLNELSISRNQFQELHSHALSFKLIAKLSIIENRFAAIDGEWLEAQIRDSIVLRGNDFGNTSKIAFRSLSVHRSYQLSEHLELRFHNNTLQTVQQTPEPLQFDERFALSLRQLQYNNAWSCEELDTSVQPPLPKTDFFRQHSEQLYFPCGNAAAETAPTTCFVQLRQLIGEQCQTSSYVAYIVVGSVALILLLLLLFGLLWYRHRQRQRRRKLDVVQPEPRTYKETQIVYQIENAGLLKTDL